MVRKGQYSIMEYLFMTIFILIIIIIFLFVVFTFQLSQMQFEQASSTEARLSSATTRILNSPYFVKDDSLFDDAKLQALLELQKNPPADFDLCDHLHDIMGFNFFINITDLNLTKEFPKSWNIDPANITKKSCSDADVSYGDNVPGGIEVDVDGSDMDFESQCNHWSFCYEPKRRVRANVLPVNIYRRFGEIIDTGAIPTTNLGQLVVGVYVE